MQQQLLSSSMKTFKPNTNNSTSNLHAQYATSNNNNNNTNQSNNLEDHNEEKVITFLQTTSDRD